MQNRKTQIAELMEGFQSLRRAVSGTSKHTPQLPPSQIAALIVIAQRKECGVKDIAQSLCITSSAATQLVDSLVRGGYVIRTASVKDRRSVALTLSAKSRKQVQKIKNQVLQRFLKIFAVLSDKEFMQYIALSKKLVSGLE